MSHTIPDSDGTPGLLGGRYAVVEVLGRGGMATVYRAFDRQLGVGRAVKVVHPSLMGRKARLRLAQEAEVMARLAHPNVVRLVELGEDDQTLFLVMELVEGGSVADRTATAGPLPPRMAVGVALGLLSALGYAHAHGVVHRDVKPHNVLLDLDGTPRVTDFGIARWEESELTRTGAILGTLAYMAPEQKASARAVDARSDLYAAGATMYAMLTGVDPHDLFAAGLDPRVAEDQLGSLPEGLGRWILAATSFRPDDRFPDAVRMAEALTAVLADLPPDPPCPPLVAPGRAQAAARRLATAATHSDEVTAAREPERSSRPALRSRGSTYGVVAALLLALMGAGSLLAVVVGSGAVLLALRAGEPPPEPVAGLPVVQALPVEVAVAPPAPVPEERPPAPVAARVVVAPVVAEPEVAEPEAPPVVEVVAPAVVEEAAPPSPETRWEVLRLPNPRGDVELTATLRAERDVVDVNGVRGRPRLVLRCKRGKLEAMLDTGLEDVEVSNLDPSMPFVSVAITAGAWSDRRMFSKNSATPGVLNLIADRKLVQRLLASPEVQLGYTSFGGAAVTATFRPMDPSLKVDLDRGCE